MYEALAMAEPAMVSDRRSTTRDCHLKPGASHRCWTCSRACGAESREICARGRGWAHVDPSRGRHAPRRLGWPLPCLSLSRDWRLGGGEEGAVAIDGIRTIHTPG